METNAIENAVSEQDIEAVRKDISVLSSWPLEKVRNLAGIVGDDIVFECMRKTFTPKQQKIAMLYDGLHAADIAPVSSLENEAQYEHVRSLLEKAFSL